MTAEVVATILAVGALLPLLTSVVQQPRWSNRTRTVLAVIVSLVAGLVAYVSQFGLNFSSVSNVVTVVVGVIVLAAGTYQAIWKPSGVAPAIERATSTGRRYLDADDQPGPDVR